MRFVLFMIACQCASASSWYASNVSSFGNGSLSNPWNLQIALKTNAVQPGDTLYLRAGRYNGSGYFSTLTGTSNNYITVRSYPGEWAVLSDGATGVLGTSLGTNCSSCSDFNVVITNSETWAIASVFKIDTERMQIANKIGNTITNVQVYRNSIATNSHAAGTSVFTQPAYVLSHSGSYVIFRDFEITSDTSTNRVEDTDDLNSIPAGLDLNAAGHGNKAINLVVHNVGQPGIGLWRQGDGGEINGCLIWGNGKYDYSEGFNGTPRGSAAYCDNISGLAGLKNNITFRNFTTGGKVYGESGPVRDFYFIGNIGFQNPLGSYQASSGSTSTSNILFRNNFMMGDPSLSYVSLSNVFQYFYSNVLVSGVFGTVEQLSSAYTNNVVFIPQNASLGQASVSYLCSTTAKANLGVTWDYNTYFLGNGSSPYNWAFTALGTSSHNGSGGGVLRYDNDGTNTWSDWSGFDAHSAYATNWPTNYLNVSVQRLDYDPNQWHIAVVSTSGQTNATLSLSDYGFANGQRYQLVDAQNWPVVVAIGTYSGSGTLILPLNLTNVSTINGTLTHYTNEHSNVREPGLFNAFVLSRESGTGTMQVQNMTATQVDFQ